MATSGVPKNRQVLWGGTERAEFLRPQQKWSLAELAIGAPKNCLCAQRMVFGEKEQSRSGRSFSAFG